MKTNQKEIGTNDGDGILYSHSGGIVSFLDLTFTTNTLLRQTNRDGETENRGRHTESKTETDRQTLYLIAK